MNGGRFAARLLDWWREHGRHDLPWQLERTAYRVWVSEVMLQQTQVATVIPYFVRFISRFPTLNDLADAQLDEVLALWSGLGYYARGRNLHKAAQLCRDQFDGQLPDDPDRLESLPGIGRSTANAIVAQAFDRRAPILDGNVKRVVARHAGIAGWPGQTVVLQKLWKAADERTPDDRAADYTQAIMDLGALVCTRSKPDCPECPVAADCRARLDDRIDELPGKKPRRERPLREITLLVLENNHGEILLQRRPPVGIWGGLWSLPEARSMEIPEEVEELCAPESLIHEFSHFRLAISFHRIRLLQSDIRSVGEDDQTRWFNLEQALSSSLPRPIRQALQNLANQPNQQNERNQPNRSK